MPTPMKEVPPLPAAAAAVMVEEEISDASSAANNNEAEAAWNCSCGKQWPATQKRCGNAQCNKWKGGKRDPFIVRRPNAPSPPTKKLKQPPQDAAATGNNNNNNNSSINWTCHNCQHVVAGNKVRCGKCHHWKGGKRTLYKKTKTITNNDDSGIVDHHDGTSLLPLASGGIMDQHHHHGDSGATLNNIIATNNNTVAKGTAVKVKASSYPYDTTQDWTCSHCSITLPGKQTRCGKCHKWRGGKRQGGWTLKAKKRSGTEEEEDDGIDRTLDWMCCNVLLPAKQTRCGKCHKWRGGKRVFSGSSNNDGGDTNKRVKSGGGEIDSNNEKVKVVSNNYQLKENDQLEVSDADVHHHHHHSLANDRRANIVFEYPIPFAPAAVYPPSIPPSVTAEEYYPPLPSPIAVAATVATTNPAPIAEI